MQGIDFESLRCVSVLTGQGTPGHDPSAFAGEPVDTARIDEVLYLPALSLQVAPGAIVPLEAIQDPWSLDFERGRAFQGMADAYRGSFDTQALDLDVCILANFYSRNFFHWISEELVKVAVLERSGFGGSYVLSSRLPDFAVEFLALLGVPAGRIIRNLDAPTVFRSATYVTAVTALRIDRYPGIFHALRQAILDGALDGASSPPRRLWMDRCVGVNNKGRELLNPEQVYPLLERYGVEVVDMAAHPVREQIRLAHGSSLLSGPHGAGFIHAMFMPPRSNVIECFSPLFINPGIFEICRLLRHRHSMVVFDNCYGGYPHGDRLMVNCSQLELSLQALD